MSHEVVGFAIPAHEVSEGNETGYAGHSGEDNQRQAHGPRLIVRGVVAFVHFVFFHQKMRKYRRNM